MSGSRRSLLLLLLACISCVVLFQVSLDGWNLGTSFTYTLYNQPKILQKSMNKEETLRSSNANSSQVTLSIPKINITASKISNRTKIYKKIGYNNSNLPVNAGKVRRIPLGKSPSKHIKHEILSNRQERLQEILKKSNNIRLRSRVDPMKSIKQMPIISPENVFKIIILTYFRAGSSFFGDLLQQNWKTFYHFEPLHSMTYNSRIGDDRIHKVFDLFNGIFNCNFSKLNDYMNWVVKPHNQFLFYHNLFLRVACHSNPKICFNSTYVNAVCQRAPIHVMKVVRLHMYHLKAYLEENPDMKIKVVYLTRDPRGIVSSRWSLDWCNGTECSDPNVLCHEMSEDLKVFDILQKQNPSNFIKIQYEDIALNPENESKKLFEFLHLPFSTSVQRFLKTHTIGRRTDDKNPYSTIRNTTSMAFSWRERFTFKQVTDVQSSCGEVLKALNHSLITSPNQLPYPNGKLKPKTINAIQTNEQKLNNSPLYLKSQIMNKTQLNNKDIHLHATNSQITYLNNTNIEIHKTFNISDKSLKNNSKNIDYILVKQFVKR